MGSGVRCAFQGSRVRQRCGTVAAAACDEPSNHRTLEPHLSNLRTLEPSNPRSRYPLRMPTKDGKLGVAIAGLGWCGAQHAAAFQHNPQCEVTWVYGRDAARTKANLEKYKLVLPNVRVTSRYEDLLEAGDVD